ncbi:MAG: hypothetical protein PHX45_06840 [Acidobacteriota bacterium]|nr:hypothetical protein [Acidobacteriota bacterium]
MTIIHAFLNGVGTSCRKARMLGYLWAVNLVFSLILITPFFLLVNREFGHSLAGGSLGRLDLVWMADFQYKYWDLQPSLLLWTLVPLGFYILVSIFLNGGILGRIAAPEEKTGPQAFFGDCGRFFWRFLRVFLISIAAYIIVFGVLFKILAAPLDAWIKSAPSEWPGLIASNIRFLIALLLLSVVQMFFDYVKVSLAAEDGKRTLQAVGRTAGFLGRNFFKAWVLYLLVAVMFFALTVAFGIAGNGFPGGGPAAVAAAFVWSQIYVLFRLWTKVLFFSTEYHFYERAHNS